MYIVDVYTAATLYNRKKGTAATSTTAPSLTRRERPAEPVLVAVEDAAALAAVSLASIALVELASTEVEYTE